MPEITHVHSSSSNSSSVGAAITSNGSLSERHDSAISLTFYNDFKLAVDVYIVTALCLFGITGMYVNVYL